MNQLINASKIIQESCTNVYQHLMDDESKFYYDKRLAYYLSGDKKYLLDIVLHLPQTATWNEYVEKCAPIDDKLIVYGACMDAQIFPLIYPNANCFAFCDRDVNKQKKGWYGKKVLSPDELITNYRDYPILINASDYYKEIEDFLLKNGIPKENIYNKGKDIFTKYPIQYFDTEIMTPVDNEIFVDGGAYDLETARKFINWTNGNYKKIYSFEPDADNFKRCKNSLEKRPIENLCLLNKGTWNAAGTLNFVMGGEGSHISEGKNNNVSIQTEAIDNVVLDEHVTFIKLDVEGAELKTLQGAKNTIIKNKPRLAISIYHKPEDIIEIPAYILSLNPDYKFYIRHYKFSYNETVLYAI